jgi:hypothetical protein
MLLASAGIPKVLNTSTAQGNTAHLGISTQLSRMIGVAELAAMLGLLVGIIWRPLAIVTAAAVILLMVGALGYHLKARDNAQAMLPAVLTAAAAVAVVLLLTFV